MRHYQNTLDILHTLHVPWGLSIAYLENIQSYVFVDLEEDNLYEGDYDELERADFSQKSSKGD